MQTFLRRLAAALSLASLALSWPLAFVSAQTAPAPEPTPIAIIGDSQNEGFVGYNALPPLLTGYQVVGSQCNRSWTVAHLRSGGGPSGSGASCFRNQSSPSFLNALTTKPKAIIVFAGGNGTDTAAELQAFVTDLKAIAPVVIWIGPFHSKDAAVNTRHTSNSQTQKNTLPGLGVNWIEAISINPAYTYSDGTHFTRAEYGQVASQLAPQILQYLAAASTQNPAATTETDEPTVPVTDAIGRTSEEVQQSIAARCADANPVFPVRLGIAIGGTTEVNGLTEYINVVYRYMTAIVLVVAIIMVTVGGFKYLLAASPLGVKDGKDVIKNGIVGMVLVLSAYVILNTINPATTILRFTQPPEDITCVEYAANLGYTNVSGLTEQQRRDLSQTGVGTMLSYWDPLLLRLRPMTVCNPAGTEASNTYLRGLQAAFNDIAVGTCPGTAVCVEGDEYAEAVSNTDLPDVLEGESNFCSEGGLYSICSKHEHCNADQNLVCLGESVAVFDEWQVCVKREGNEEGSPCGFGFTGPGMIDMVDVGCAAGLTCVSRQKNYPDDADGVVQMDGLRVCTKQVRDINLSEIQGLNEGNPASAALVCRYHRDCANEDSRCAADIVSNTRRACVSKTVTDGAPCGAVYTGGDGSFYPCTGSNGFTCAYCPADGTRQWTRIQGTPRHNTIGQCKPNANLGQNCAGN